MKDFLMTTRKYLLIYWLFVKNSIMSQMEYRANFIIAMFIQLANMGIKLTYVIVLYSTGAHINGFSPDQMMIMIGTYSALSGVFVSFYLLNFSNLSTLVQNGTLDTYIVKPIDLQFIATLKSINVAFAATSVLGGGVMIGVGWVRSGINFSIVNILGFLGFTLWGLFLTYSVFLIPNLLCFWTISSRGLNALVGPMWDFNNMPMTIYDGAIKFIGTFIVPVFLITNMSGLFIMKKLDTSLVIWSLIAPILFFALCRWLWKKAMRRYVSVSG